MSNSYRIRTKPGVDSSIKILIDQEFEYLEILSLKILQSQIYTRQCSDYGVIVGRVSINNGFGIPNAKVSVFIPLDSMDENDPVISELYPYKTLSDLNEDGYRYNLLPYKQQHPGHNPTGTFFTREDVLINPTLIEVYDKYYKYNAITNDSGDYMIFGVPVGAQTVVVDLDLSDIGEFSLAPQDLIRMGITTESQVSGTNFKSSTNLRELPQIITFVRNLEVEPLWGQPEICNLGITRTDFDLSAEFNINITPTAIFMGSLVSSIEEQYVKKSCKPTLTSGALCSLVAGPGEILAIRHTIAQDSNGRPILETIDLESGGQVIDENGTWLVDLPMNLDYVITNEFGEQVISDDPKNGIPTKGRYRFKVKWNQSPSVSADPIKRGYFLVPNIKEYGWKKTGNINVDPLTNNTATAVNQDAAQRSYAFSLDWADYGLIGTSMGNQMIDEAIRCEDKFYEFQYNKVYTVSQLITQYRNGYGNWRIIAVKDILDSDVKCSSDNNKFPTNDAVYRFDLIYLLFTIMMFVFRPILYVLLLVVHILAFFLMLIGPILAIIAIVVYLVVITVCTLINAIIWALNGIPFVSIDYLDCPDVEDIKRTVDLLLNLYKKFTNLRLPNLSYPDCEFCQCTDGDAIVIDNADYPAAVATVAQTAQEAGANAVLTPFELSTNYNATSPYNTDNLVYESLFAGASLGNANQANNPLTPQTRAPKLKSVSGGQGNQGNDYAFTTSLTQSERLNLFNTKAKFFRNDINNNPGGGVNIINVSFNPNDIGVTHQDNVIVLMVDPGSASTFLPGNLITFQDPVNSTDPNMTGFTSINDYGTTSSTGTTVNNKPGSTSNVGNITVQYADYTNGNGPALTKTYTSQQADNDAQYAKFPMDVEYFQVITAQTYSDYLVICNQPGSFGTYHGLKNRFIDNSMKFNRIFGKNLGPGYWINELNINYPGAFPLIKPSLYFPEMNEQIVVFLVRGVDPYSTRSNCEYDLSVLYGDTVTFNTYGFTGRVKVTSGVGGAPKYHLNQPIKPGFKNVRHNLTNNFDTDTYSGQKLYFDSFHYQPSPTGPAAFSGFNSNLQTYYSSLDNGSMSFTPQAGSPNLDTGFNSDTTYGVNVDGNINYFAREFNSQPGLFDPNTYNYLAPINPYNVPNTNFPNTVSRGYYDNEIIEGGSGMYCQTFVRAFSVAAPFASISMAGTYDYKSYYYAPKYPIANMSYNLGGTRKIIMRSDRLPTSTTLQNNLNNSFALHTNVNFSVYSISDDGTSVQAQGVGGGQSGSLTGSTADSLSDGETEPQIISSVIDSFNCGAMINLDCYKEVNGELVVDYTGPCGYTFWNKKLVTKGCYTFITTIFLSLISDFKLLTEWISRLLITFAACRNVWGHLFTNNWINGTLYAFNFNNDVTFTSPLSPNPNQARYSYCDDVVIFHNSTNTFYYRSSPWDRTDFIGQNRATPNAFTSALFGGYGGNMYNLLYPTTIMDLGPRNDYLQDIVMSDKYDGYVVNKLKSTTFSDVTELLNLFVITRLANQNFLQLLIAGGNVFSYFSRVKNMVDGDYAQSISINSELGVAPFQSANYPDRPGQDSIYINTLSDKDQVFGIFYQSDTRLRDLISPKRTIIDDTVPATNVCAFSNIEVSSQDVPFYQWEVSANEVGSNDSIFGSQNNGWMTDPLSANSFFTKKYQSLDRIEPASRYFRTNSTAMTKYFKGYLYSVEPRTVNGVCSIFGNVLTIGSVNPPLLQEGFVLSAAGIIPNTTIISQLTVTLPSTAAGGSGTYLIDTPQNFGGGPFTAVGFIYSGVLSTQDQNTPKGRVINTGAPFYFYFGLKRGGTAFDRFVIKWVDTNTITA